MQRAQDAILLPVAGETRALLKWVEAQWEAYQAARAGDLGARLARGGRDRDTWLRALSANEGDFRTAPLAPEQLWTLVEGPGTPPTARAAAALVLARGAGDEDRRRLRIAATGCEHPRLRVVLDQAGRGVDEEVLGEALDGVEDEEEAPRVRGVVR